MPSIPLQVLELRGDLFGSPSIAFTSADPVLDDGIGIEFAQGEMATAANGLVLVWLKRASPNVTRVTIIF